MIAFATIVDWKALGESALASLAAGVFVTFAFSLAIVWTTKAVELRRADRHGAAVAAGTAAGLALIASLAAVAAGLIVMIS